MARNTLGIFEDTFAETGERVKLDTYSTGYGPEYETDTFPEREPLNDVLSKATAVATDVNKFGALLPWDTGLNYEAYAPVVGSDGVYYVAAISNSGRDPSDALNRPLYWGTFADFIGLTNPKSDSEVIAISSHNTYSLTTSRTSRGLTTRTYAVADFVGSGLDISEVRGIYVRYLLVGDLYSTNTYGKIWATYPDGSTLMIADQRKNIDDNEGLQGGVAFIPINKNQTSFTIKIDLDFWDHYSMTGSVTIQQATQRKD